MSAPAELMEKSTQLSAVPEPHPLCRAEWPWAVDPTCPGTGQPLGATRATGATGLWMCPFQEPEVPTTGHPVTRLPRQG